MARNQVERKYGPGGPVRANYLRQLLLVNDYNEGLCVFENTSTGRNKSQGITTMVHDL